MMNVTKFGVRLNEIYSNNEKERANYYMNSTYVKRDGSGVFSGNVSMGGNRITELQNPTDDKDAVNKEYVDKRCKQKVCYRGFLKHHASKNVFFFSNKEANHAKYVNQTSDGDFTVDKDNYGESNIIFNHEGVYSVSFTDGIFSNGNDIVSISIDSRPKINFHIVQTNNKYETFNLTFTAYFSKGSALAIATTGSLNGVASGSKRSGELIAVKLD